MPSQISITVDASDTSTYELAEHYQCRVTWTESGALQYVETVYFDCVLEPYIPDVSLNDLVTEVADLEEKITRQAAAGDTANVRMESPLRAEVRRGYASNRILFYPKTPHGGWVTASACTFTLHEPDGTQITSGSGTITAISTTASRTADQLAGVYASHAWLDTMVLIRSHMEAKGWVRPRLIIDREIVRRVIVAFAVARVYIAEGGGPDSPEAALAEEWRREAQTRFASMGPLRYDSTEDRQPDSDLTGWAVVSTRRAW